MASYVNIVIGIGIAFICLLLLVLFYIPVEQKKRKRRRRRKPGIDGEQKDWKETSLRLEKYISNLRHDYAVLENQIHRSWSVPCNKTR